MRTGRLREVESQWPGHPAESELGLEPRPNSAAWTGDGWNKAGRRQRAEKGSEQASGSLDVESPASSPPMFCNRSLYPQGSTSLLPLQVLSLIHPPPQESLPLQPHPAVPPCSPFGLWAPPATLSLCPPDMQSLRTAQAALGKGCLASSFICVYLFTGELYPTEIRWGPGGR